MDDLQAFRQIVLAEHENGASVETIAGTFGISQEAVREHLRKARHQRDQWAQASAVTNELSEAGQPGCCDGPGSTRGEIAMLLTPGCSMEQRVDALARVTASTCAGLSDDELRYFFSRAFELDSEYSECTFFARFSQAYKTARDALERKPRAASVAS